MNLLRSVTNLVNSLVEERVLELTVLNLTGSDLRLPAYYAHAAQGKILIRPDFFWTLKVLKQNEHGCIIFHQGDDGEFSGAIEFHVGAPEAPLQRLFVGATNPLVGSNRFIVQWNGAQSLAEFYECMPNQFMGHDTQAGELILDSDTGFQGGDYSVKLSEVKYGSHASATLAVSRASKSASRCFVEGISPSPVPVSSQSLPIKRQKSISLNVVNYADVGITFPPNFAALVTAELVWKENAYVPPRQSCLVIISDDLHFTGAVMCSLGDDELLYFSASNPLVGKNRFSLKFTNAKDPDPPATGLLSVAEEPADCPFLGIPTDATVQGKSFEALVTDVVYGDHAKVTVAIYSKST